MSMELEEIAPNLSPRGKSKLGDSEQRTGRRSEERRMCHHTLSAFSIRLLHLALLALKDS